MYLADPLLNIVHYLTDETNPSICIVNHLIYRVYHLFYKVHHLMYETNPLKVELHHLCIKPTLQTIMCNI